MSERLRSIWIFLPGLVMAVVGMAVAGWMPINHDVAFLLHMARRVAEDPGFFHAKIDPNTPMILYLSLIPERLGGWLGVSTIQAFKAFCFLLLSGCVVLSWRALGRIPLLTGNARHAGLLFAALCYALFFLPNAHGDFGQRPHLMMALALPYLGVMLARAAQADMPRGLALLAGALAGVGFSIKPHFLLLFIAGELFLMTQRRHFLAWRRPEAYAVMAVTLLYYLHMLLVTPDYFFHLFPMLLRYYPAYHAPFVLALWSAVFVLAPPVIAVILAPARKPYDGLLRYALWMVVAGAALYLSQQTLWSYTEYPARFFTVLLLAVACMRFDRAASAFCAALALYSLYLHLLFGSFAFAPMREQDARQQAFTDLIRAQARHQRVAFLSLEIPPAFPAINYAQAEWALPMGVQFFLPAHYPDGAASVAYHAPKHMDAQERFFFRATIDALTTHAPRLIAVATPPHGRGLHRNFSYGEYYLQDPGFAKLWKRYRRVQSMEGYDIYLRDQ